jgi:FKBP-type peptidyl-prolyl cis-trans isomerase SlyD
MRMNISKDSVVTFSYQAFELTPTPKGAISKLLEAGKNMAYLHGGYNNALPQVEHALEGKAKGFAVVLDLGANAFGARDESLTQVIARSEFPTGVKVGGQLRGTDGQGHERAFTVVKIKGNQVLLDANHPWAGKNVRFAVKVVDVRQASSEEVAHGHAHGDHGHQH